MPININPKHIQQLRAGHIMEINQFNYGFSNYYSIPNCINNFINLDEFKQKLIDSVKLRLMSDRKIGCLLSGGLDSSLIASILAKHFGKKINTFTIGFEEISFDEDQLELAKFAYDHVYDLENYYKVYDVFSFSKSGEELEEYIENR